MNLYLSTTQHVGQLTISRTYFSLITNSLGNFLKVFIVSSILFIPNSTLQEVNSNLVFIKLLPLLTFPSIYRSIKRIIDGETYVFDISHDLLTKNHDLRSSLRTINRVCIEYIPKHRHKGYRISLHLEYSDSKKKLLFDKITHASAVKTGLQLAKFLKTEFLDNFSEEAEILWGKSDVTSNDIEFVNQCIKK